MSFVGNVDATTNILHVVRDAAGALVTDSLTGFTVAVLDEGQVRQDTAATWTEPVTTGYLSIAVTPDALGNWLVSVGNPSGNFSVSGLPYGSTADYGLQCVASTVGVSPSGTFLTTLNNLKERLGISSSDTGSANADPYNDTYLNNLIARASVEIESYLGRTIVQTTHTEYVDGDGSEWLNLRQGPVISITSVASVDWSSGSAVTDSVDTGAYLVYGDDTDWLLPGMLRYAGGGSWVSGRRNWEVVYAAGFASVPYDLEQACLELCVWQKNRRKDAATNSRDIGSGAIGFRAFDEKQQILEQMLGPYMNKRVPV